MTESERIEKESLQRFRAICTELNVDPIKVMDYPMVPVIVKKWMFYGGSESNIKQTIANLAIFCPGMIARKVDQ